MSQQTLSGRGLLGFEPIRRGLRGLGVILQLQAEKQLWSLFGVLAAQQRIPARILESRSHLHVAQNSVHFTFPAGRQAYLLGLVHRAKVQDDVADAFLLFGGRIDGKALKLDGSSLQPGRDFQSTHQS